MDNFVNFLLDYYVWILGVLLIIIVTIIGFLVDSNQKRKKKEKQFEKKEEKLEEVQTVQSMPEENNTPIMEAKDEKVVVENIADNNIVSKPAEKIETPNSVVTDDKSLNLSEQKPHFESREVNIPVTPNVVQSNVSTPINNVQQPINMVPSMPNGSNINPQTPSYSNFEPKPINVVPINNANNSQNVNMNMQNMNNQYMTPNMNSQVVNQQPANPVYNMSGNVNGVTGTVNQVPVQPIPNPVRQPINSNNGAQQIQNNQTVTGTNYGINFVTGDNNNSIDDSWKL